MQTVLALNPCYQLMFDYLLDLGFERVHNFRGNESKLWF